MASKERDRGIDTNGPWMLFIRLQAEQESRQKSLRGEGCLAAVSKSGAAVGTETCFGRAVPST